MSGIVLRTRAVWTSALLVAGLLGAAAPAFAQSDEQRAGARTLATTGAQAFNEGRYKDALDLFRKAESLVHAPPHLLFIARSHAKLGQYVASREAYLKIIKEELPPNAPQAFRDAQAAAEEERKQVEPHIARLLIKVEGAEGAKDLSIAVDGQPFPAVMLGVPQPMDPGSHTVTATATGFKAAPASVTLQDAGQGAVTLKLEVDESAPAPLAPAAAGPTTAAPAGAPPATQPAPDRSSSGDKSGLRIGSYVGFGVGAVGVALGTVFVLKSSSKRKDADKAASALEAQCGSICDADSPAAQHVDELDNQARSAKTLGIVGYVVGGLGVATGVTLLVLSSHHDEPQAAFVAPFIGFGNAGLRGTF